MNSEDKAWRRKGIISFFFTRFPETFVEVDLWKAFMRWDKVWSVYIAKKRDKSCEPYGFVRFAAVENVKVLEGKSYNIYFGKVQVRVNLRKFNKGDGYVERVDSVKLNPHWRFQ